MALTLALPAAGNAQTYGQSACPDGVTETGVLYLSVTDVKVSGGRLGGTFGVQLDNQKTQATLRGGPLPITPHDIEDLTAVTGDWSGDFSHADMAFMVRDEDGPVHGGFWIEVGTVGWRGGTRDLQISAVNTFHNLKPATKHVAQLIVSRLRHESVGRGNRVVTNEFVSGVGAPISGNKPKPVLTQLCFETPALPGS